MKIAVIGAGISGLTCAHLLSPHHEVHLYEQDARLGGHTNTVPVTHEGAVFPVDTGFIVFNERNYPHFCRLLARLGVASRSTTMSFSVRDEATGFEFGGASLAGLIGSPLNVLRPRWWRLAHGLATLGRVGKATLRNLPPNTTIADLCRNGPFTPSFLDDYLIPMASAIWSAPRDELLRFPAGFFLRFFDNHGMLDLRERPVWRTVVGGSHSYVRAILASSRFALHVNQRVEAIRREPLGVRVRAAGADDQFDHVIIAAHSDQALAMLADASSDEREILGAMPYQANEAVLHTDASVLPRRRRVWAAWNYRVQRAASHAVTTCERVAPAAPVLVTYNMSMLQGLGTRSPICVTLNDAGDIDPARIIARYQYHHPLYTTRGDAARARWSAISGSDRTHFCGAYWGNGFHEDGVVSALRVCESLGITGALA